MTWLGLLLIGVLSHRLYAWRQQQHYAQIPRLEALRQLLKTP